MPAVDQAPPASLVCRHLAPRSICPQCIRADVAQVEDDDPDSAPTMSPDWIRGARAAADVAASYNADSAHPYRLDDCILAKLNIGGPPRPNEHASRSTLTAAVSAARTLPVTTAERAAADMLRAWQAWRPDASDSIAMRAFMVACGRAAMVARLADALDLTPAGAALLARVEEAPVLEPTAAIVAFIRAEETRYRRNSWDSSHDAAGRERCANKASVLATVAAYIERGDHLAPPIDAPPAKEPR